MKFLFTSKSSWSHPRANVLNRVLICALLGAGPVQLAQACGPDFPNRYLDAPEGRILASPEAVFAHEVERIAPRGMTEKRRSEGAFKPDVRVDLETAYRLGREAAARTERCEGVSGDARREARDEAVKWFRLTRSLVEAGAQDASNLSRESVGWEAFAELHTGNFIPAITLYLRHHQEGDDTAINSLRFVMRRLFRDETWQANGLGEKLAHDAQARQVWTAWLVAQGCQDFGWDGENTQYMQRIADTAQRWAEILNRAGIYDLAQADRFAWVAYRGGNVALAQEWVRLAPADSGAAEWLRGKLALRAGDLSAGERHLRAAMASGDFVAQREVILGELGRVCLARDCLAGALTAWLDGGHWEDAAYVAERVMTLEELRVFVDERAGKSPAMDVAKNGEQREQNWWRMNWGPLELQLRHLLARRLMRANRVEEAEKYFPEELRLGARGYAVDVRMGFDVKRADKKRAAAFWRAAKIVRAQGMELLGTELEPDWAIWGGSSDTGSAAEDRFAPEMQASGTFAATKQEEARVAEHAVPEKRFHYRYRAAQLAWWAAGLMPNNSEETAAILAEAGGWLKNRDPKAAKAFYEALAIRCGRTELGKRAAERRWFPDAAKAPDS